MGRGALTLLACLASVYALAAVDLALRARSALREGERKLAESQAKHAAVWFKSAHELFTPRPWSGY